MQDLRLIGVHEDGGHLLLADEEGSRFRVALDDALRAAARHQRPHHGQVSIDVEAGHRPRDVQALIRAGLTAQEVAERCGWPVEKVHKYEVPILAEREYVAGLARLVRLRRASSAQPSPTLAGRVADRLQTRGVSLDEVSWDAHRQAGSEWTVLLTFPAGGRQRQATWGFDPSTHAIHPRDDEARWFSEDDASAAEPEVVVREVPVYDVEAEGGVGAERSPAGPDPLDLVTAMRQRTNARSRRGSRRRPSEGAALPLGPDHNGVEPAAEAAAPEVPEVSPTLVTEQLAEEQAVESADGPGHPPADEDADDPPDASGPVSTQPPLRAERRPGARVPVPSWEDIVLGTKPGAD